jgi:pantetheine-phosphate adenylyltransferase
MPMPDDADSWDDLHVMFATAAGNIRRNRLSDFTNIKRNGKIAMKLAEGDELVGVAPCNESDDLLLATRDGKAIRFAVDAVRVFRGRDSTGVRGVKLLGKDSVVSMSIITDESNEFVLSVTENGYGKRTQVSDYRRTGRGGQGVANIETSARNGRVMASFTVVEEDQLMLVTNYGQIIRIRVHGGEGDSIRIAGRKTQGVRLFDVSGDDDERVVSAGLIRDADDSDDENTADTEGDGGADGALMVRVMVKAIKAPSRGRISRWRRMSRHIVIYPGTFDPLTYGHLDIIQRASRLGDELIVAVAANAGKGPLLTVEERTGLVNAECKRLSDDGTVTVPVRVLNFSNLLTDFAREQGASVIVRGLRAVSDFEIEFQMASINKRLHGDLETIFLMAAEHQHFVASRFVKEVSRYGGDISSFVPASVVRMMKDIATRKS